MKLDFVGKPSGYVTRRSFIGGLAGGVFAGMAQMYVRAGGSANGIADGNWSETAHVDDQSFRYADWQKDIDAVTPEAYFKFQRGGTSLSDSVCNATYAAYPGLKRYDDAFARAVADIRSISVPDGKAAVWYVYNMGVIVKTAQTLFSIDLNHRQAESLADELTFALVTHNHSDHFSDRFYSAMDSRGKTVISNFLSNYGAYYGKKMPGGYTREPKTFTIGDVTVRTSVSDHNGYLLGFTMPFEIIVGDYTIYHTGDTSNIAQLNPSRQPDLWIMHPYCILKIADGIRKFSPRLTAVTHLQELGHARDRWRFTYDDGLKMVRKAQDAGGVAVIPLWGDRIV